MSVRISHIFLVFNDPDSMRRNQVFHRIFLNWGLSCVFLMTGLGLFGFERMTTGIKFQLSSPHIQGTYY